MLPETNRRAASSSGLKQWPDKAKTARQMDGTHSRRVIVAIASRVKAKGGGLQGNRVKEQTPNRSASQAQSMCSETRKARLFDEAATRSGQSSLRGGLKSEGRKSQTTF
ncbi:MAG: hypothetical protein Q8L54_03850 [Devosia sp.]|nr:hypothetical protein [Devosia sp.]